MRTPPAFVRFSDAIWKELAEAGCVDPYTDSDRWANLYGLVAGHVSDAMDSRAAEIRRDTIEKAKDVVRAYADCYQPTEEMLADLDALLQEEETK